MGEGQLGLLPLSMGQHDLNMFSIFPPPFREVWPDDAFGHSGMSADEEVDTIKSILFNPAAG